MRAAIAAIFAVLVLAGCTEHVPPVGRWEGTLDTAEAMVAVRVEIDTKANIRIMAPNAEDVGDKDEDRAAMRVRLASDLAAAWDRVEPRVMDFDGQTFRKPHGIAPQMVWDAAKKRMDIVVYLGKKQGIRFPLRTVDDFSDDPWQQ